MTCVGAILWSVLGCTHGWKLFLQFSFFAYGVYASRINTAILAIVLLFVQTRDIVRIARYKMVFLSVGLILPGILVMCLLLTVGRETEAHGKKTDPNFQYGETQAYVALTVLTASFLITVVAMILGQQMQHRRLYDTVPIQSNSADEASRRLLEATDNEEETSTTTTNSSQQAANGSSQVVNPSYQNASGVRPRVTTSNQERYQSRESPVPIEDLIAVTPPQSDALARPRQGVATACPVQCSSPEGGAGRPRQQSRYR